MSEAEYEPSPWEPVADHVERYLATDGTDGSISATAEFDLPGGSTTSFKLACMDESGAGEIAGTTMTAIFVPAP